MTEADAEFAPISPWPKRKAEKTTRCQGASRHPLSHDVGLACAQTQLASLGLLLLLQNVNLPEAMLVGFALLVLFCLRK